MLSLLAVEAEMARGDLRMIDVAGCDLRRTLRAVWPEGRQLIAPASDFVRSVRRTAAC